MTYDGWMSSAVQAVEAVGGLILVVGAVAVGAQLVVAVAKGRPGGYHRFRVNLARVLQAGLEVLIIADVLRTIVSAPSGTEVVVLSAIVAVRIALSFALQTEIDGMAPWRRVSPGTSPDVGQTRPVPQVSGWDPAPDASTGGSHGGPGLGPPNPP